MQTKWADKNLIYHIDAFKISIELGATAVINCCRQPFCVFVRISIISEVVHLKGNHSLPEESFSPRRVVRHKSSSWYLNTVQRCPMVNMSVTKAGVWTYKWSKQNYTNHSCRTNISYGWWMSFTTVPRNTCPDHCLQDHNNKIVIQITWVCLT